MLFSIELCASGLQYTKFIHNPKDKKWPNWAQTELYDFEIVNESETAFATMMHKRIQCERIWAIGRVDADGLHLVKVLKSVAHREGRFEDFTIYFLARNG